MEVILILVGASLTMAVGFLVAFIWALRRGQFDDLVTPSIRMLFDTERANEPDKRRRSGG